MEKANADGIEERSRQLNLERLRTTRKMLEDLLKELEDNKPQSTPKRVDPTSHVA